mgnify:CR=1 FL=1
MYTVEFDLAGTTITTLDEQDAYDDVEVYISEDNTVFIRQHIQDVEEVNVIYMSYGQLLDVVAAMNSSEGAYRLESRK